MERRRLAGSPWSVQACVVISLLVVLGGRNHSGSLSSQQTKNQKKFSKMRKHLKARNLRVLFKKSFTKNKIMDDSSTKKITAIQLHVFALIFLSAHKNRIS